MVNNDTGFNPPPEAVALAKVMTQLAPTLIGLDPDGIMRKGRCIEATKIGVTVLHRLYVECVALPCDVGAMNVTARAQLLGVPVAAEYANNIAVAEPWSVGARVEHDARAQSKREPARRNGFNAHLVIGGHDWFCDLTARQFHRPDRGIFVDGCVVGPRVDAVGTEMGLAMSGAIRWRWRPEVKHYRTTHAWRDDMDAAMLDNLVLLTKAAM